LALHGLTPNYGASSEKKIKTIGPLRNNDLIPYTILMALSFGAQKNIISCNSKI
jgi:hypothetical protein